MSRRRFKKRRFRKRRGQGLFRMRKQLKAIASNAELKYLDLEDQQVIADVHTGGSWTRLNIGPTITAGTGKSNRIGNKIKCKRLTLRGYMNNGRGTAVDTAIRIVVLRAKFQNNVDQVSSLVYSDSDNINSLRLMEHKKRYKVYFDQTFTMKASSETAVQQFLPIKINIPLNSIMTFNGANGDYRDIERNGLWIYACSTTTTGSANCPGFAFNARLTYYDS